jgi:glycosyltransferase involved in cell wall biosynthesis
MKVLLVGHACGPDRGSEPGLTWNWALSLSRRHQIYVLTHPQFRPEIEAYMSKHPNANLEFCWVNLPTWPSWIDPWRPAQNNRGIRLHYLVWQWLAYREATRMHERHNFDIVHHVSWGTVSAPPSLWRLPIPFVWGPVGGGMTTPRNFRHYFGADASMELLRTLRIRLLPWAPFLRKAVKNSAMLVATNRETAQLMKQAGALDVRRCYDNAVSARLLSDQMPCRSPNGEMKLLWAGSLEPRKALRLGIEALAQLTDAPVRLLVAGDGPRRDELESLTRELGVGDRVEFLGTLAWTAMPSLFLSADAFLFTSLRDSCPSVVLEAMSQALPIITLDHQGVAGLVPEEAGVKVPVTTPTSTVAALAEGIRLLANSPETRLKMGEAGWNFARAQTWERRAAEMTEWYEECVRNRDAYSICS